MKTLDNIIESFASLEADETAVRDAQQRLEARLRSVKSGIPASKSRRGGWLAAIASAAAITFAVLWLPLQPTPAFAAVQDHFRHFETLRFWTEQRVAGKLTLRTRVLATRSGDVRVEIGDDMTVIVNSSQQRVLTLVRPSRMAILSPLVRRVEEDESLKWLEDIREFQGQAQRLPEPRQIDGKQAFGWKLAAGGMDMVLWATREGLPLQMTMNAAANIQLDYRFEFGVPLAAELFSTQVPAGYRIGGDED
ncbi:MAG TPA: hypothetical protein VFZ95_07505 [Steroidobacteraceae bacterium]